MLNIFNDYEKWDIICYTDEYINTLIGKYILEKQKEIFDNLFSNNENWVEFKNKNNLLFDEIYTYYSKKEILSKNDIFDLIILFWDTKKLNLFEISEFSIDINEFILYHLSFSLYSWSINEDMKKINEHFNKNKSEVPIEIYYKLNYKNPKNIFESIKNSFNLFKWEISLDTFFQIYMNYDELYTGYESYYFKKFIRSLIYNDNYKNIIPTFNNLKEELEKNKSKYKFKDNLQKENFISFIFLHSKYEIQKKTIKDDLNYFYDFYAEHLYFWIFENYLNNIIDLKPINKFLESSNKNIDLFEKITLEYFTNWLIIQERKYNNNDDFIYVNFKNHFLRSLYNFFKKHNFIFKNKDLSGFFNSKIIDWIFDLHRWYLNHFHHFFEIAENDFDYKLILDILNKIDYKKLILDNFEWTDSLNRYTNKHIKKIYNCFITYNLNNSLIESLWLKELKKLKDSKELLKNWEFNIQESELNGNKTELDKLIQFFLLNDKQIDLDWTKVKWFKNIDFWNINTYKSFINRFNEINKSYNYAIVDILFQTNDKEIILNILDDILNHTSHFGSYLDFSYFIKKIKESPDSDFKRLAEEKIIKYNKEKFLNEENLFNGCEIYLEQILKELLESELFKTKMLDEWVKWITEYKLLKNHASNLNKLLISWYSWVIDKLWTENTIIIMKKHLKKQALKFSLINEICDKFPEDSVEYINLLFDINIWATNRNFFYSLIDDIFNLWSKEKIIYSLNLLKFLYNLNFLNENVKNKEDFILYSYDNLLKENIDLSKLTLNDLYQKYINYLDSCESKNKKISFTLHSNPKMAPYKLNLYLYYYKIENKTCYINADNYDKFEECIINTYDIIKYNKKIKYRMTKNVY